MSRFARTQAALVAYDSTKPQRDAAWLDALTNAAVWACVRRDKTAEDRVRRAFAKDTSDVNSRDRAFLVHPDDPWLRRIVDGSDMSGIGR